MKKLILLLIAGSLISYTSCKTVDEDVEDNDIIVVDSTVTPIDSVMVVDPVTGETLIAEDPVNNSNTPTNKEQSVNNNNAVKESKPAPAAPSKAEPAPPAPSDRPQPKIPPPPARKGPPPPPPPPGR